MILFSLLAPALAASPDSDSEPEVVEARWDLSVGSEHRWEVESRVAYPQHLWLYADQNTDVRALSLGVNAIVDCVVEEAMGPRRSLDCTLEDVSLIGRARPTEVGLLQPVLDEIDGKLTGAPVDIVMREDGRITFVDVRPNRVSDFANRRTREMDQTLRLVVAKALAPLDFRLPAKMPLDQPWDHGTAQTTQMPVPWGLGGRTSLIHESTKLSEDQVEIRSAGRIAIRDGGGAQVGDVRGWSVFDHEAGQLVEAQWTVDTEPSPGLGLFIAGYQSVSQVRALELDDTPDLPQTKEIVTTGNDRQTPTGAIR